MSVMTGALAIQRFGSRTNKICPDQTQQGRDKSCLTLIGPGVIVQVNSRMTQIRLVALDDDSMIRFDWLMQKMQSK